MPKHSVVVLVMLLMFTSYLSAPANAGTYDVVSCAAPGADGQNHSLVYSAGSWDPQYAAQVESWYEHDTSCGDGLIVRSRTLDSTLAKWLTSAAWRFDAPAGTEIVQFASWHYAEARDSGGDDPNTSLVDESDHWEAVLADDRGVVGGPQGETCVHGLNVAVCTFGVPGGARSEHRVLTQRLRWQIGCGGQIVESCATSFGGYPLATMVVYGTQITLQDDSAPVASLGGALVTPGWHRPGDGLVYSASDNSGIRSATLTAGAASVSDPRACDPTYPVPCGNASGQPLQVAGTLPDGSYPVRLTVADAAGNQTAVDAAVAVDGSPPSVDLRPPRGRTLVVGARDAGSGFAAGEIFVRNGTREAFRALPTRRQGGTLRARLDRGRPGAVAVQVGVRDVAGNEARGAPARFRITSVTSQRLRAQVRRGGRVRVKFGRAATIRGQLVLSARRPVAGVPVTVTTTERRRGAVPRVETTGTVAPNGRFVLRLGKGPARTAEISYPGGSGFLAASRRLRLLVPASSTLNASRLRLGGAGTVRFGGRVRGAPRAGLVVVLQGKERGRWRTFADARTGAGGRWSAPYRFSGRPGSYPVRARIRRQADLPYETGYSKRVTVHVR